MLCKDCTEIYCFYRDEVARTACYYENFIIDNPDKVKDIIKDAEFYEAFMAAGILDQMAKPLYIKVEDKDVKE